jgi:hypothetical protein
VLDSVDLSSVEVEQKLETLSVRARERKEKPRQTIRQLIFGVAKKGK